MNLHEYQSKLLFKQYQLPIPIGYICHSLDEVKQSLSAIQTASNVDMNNIDIKTDPLVKNNANKWVAKCQVHAGGRGKAGGIICSENLDDIAAFAAKWLGQRLVTYQTDKNGQPVNKILLEQAADIQQEYYLSVVVDRALQRIIVMASSEGGVDIEKVAATTPELIHKVVINPLVGPCAYQGRELAFKLGLDGKVVNQFSHIFIKLVQLFIENDLALVEVNPLVLSQQNSFICLDAKVILDDNALYRHPQLSTLRDLSQEDAREAQAVTNGLSYVALEGNIGCMVNGAGLAMATMDMIKLYGGEPANFLDVGGGTTRERVAEAFKLILSDQNVTAILVNIFGGIVRCDLIADGIIAAIKDIGLKVPVVVRLEGNNAELARRALAESKLNIISAESLMDAAQKITAVAK